MAKPRPTGKSSKNRQAVGRDLPEEEQFSLSGPRRRLGPSTSGMNAAVRRMAISVPVGASNFIGALAPRPSRWTTLSASRNGNMSSSASRSDDAPARDVISWVKRRHSKEFVDDRVCQSPAPTTHRAATSRLRRLKPELIRRVRSCDRRLAPCYCCGANFPLMFLLQLTASCCSPFQIDTQFFSLW